MKTINILILFLMLCRVSFGTVIYVDNSLASGDITNGSYSIVNRDNSGSDGNCYDSLEDALFGTGNGNGDQAASVGDTIYVRAGTYAETYGTTGSQGAAMEISTSLNGTAWTSGNFTSIIGYPDEAVIIDGGNGASGHYFAIGFGGLSWNSGGGALAYILFENLSVTEGSAGGISWKKGPITIRYCYIYDNGKGSVGDGNRGGIHAMRPENCLIEYNWFYNNSGDADNNKTDIIFYADYLYNSFDINNCNKGNEVRYNYFSGTSHSWYKDKASQHLGSYDNSGYMTDYTNQELGNKIHHNIAVGKHAMFRQYFEQVYNNISDGGRYSGEDGGNFFPVFAQSYYNNIAIGSGAYITQTIGYNRTESNLDFDWLCVNNISDQVATAGYGVPIGIGINWSRTCTEIYGRGDSLGLTIVDRNLIHSPVSSSYHFGYADSYTCAERYVTTTAFNDSNGTTNYNNSTAGLFTSGSTGYVTDSSFVVTGSTEIRNGGLGGAHPFLIGVMLPYYLGAVAPGDSAWVYGVTDSLTDLSWLRGQSGVDRPGWISNQDLGGGSSPAQGSTTANVDTVYAE